jgi:murein DD-endopeptidase MepM/ murein hydrolase activator NlpD
VQLQHHHRVVTTYLHLDTVMVRRGDRVFAGQPIARMEAGAGKRHVHVEMRHGNQMLDTTPLLAL